MKNLFVGMGEALWDIFPDGKKIGGAPANFTYHAMQFGFDGVAVSAVGDDEPGRELTGEFDRIGLRYDMERLAYPTGTVNVRLDRNGVPDYEITEDVAWDHIPITGSLTRLALRTTVFCFGTLAQRGAVSREAINHFLDTMPDGPGQYKICDINLRQHYYSEEVIRNSLDKCNVLKINDEEFGIVCDMFDIPTFDVVEAARRIMGRFSLGLLILTCGTAGSYAVFPDGVTFLPTPVVTVEDTVGAGDSFTAAFFSGMVKGLPPSRAHRLAVDVSAYICSCAGAMPRLPEHMVKI